MNNQQNKTIKYAANEIMRKNFEKLINNGKNLPNSKAEEEILKFVNKGVPPRYNFADIPLSDSDKILALLAKSKGEYIWGPVGAGKSFRLYGIYRFLMASGYDCAICNYINLISKLRDAVSSGDDELDLLNFEKIRVLFIDDLGVEKGTEWVNEITYRIINSRYENLLPTFFASNLSLFSLAEKIGDRMASRIAEMCEPVKIEGEDKRI